MKRTKSELFSIKDFIDSSYNKWGNLLMVNTEKKFNPDSPELGYCYKYISDDKATTIYKIVCSKIGKENTDFRILMHEYGHIYLGHLDGIHEQLDTQVCNVFRDHRGELIETINKECGIDFADKLIERVIDDPVLNHSLHNIAMDMEVNSKVLSKEDVEEMEKEISEVLPDYQEEFYKYLKEKTSDENLKKKIDDSLKKIKNESKIKLILPERYYLSPNVPFPNNLTYPDYLILIVKHLDQFVKMLVSIKKGGNGDTSSVTSEDIKNALSRSGSGSSSGNGEGQQGEGCSSSSDSGGDDGQQGNNLSGDKGMQSLSDLMEEMGMTNKTTDSPNGKENGKDKNGNLSKNSKYKGKRGDKDEDNVNGNIKDHGSDSRDEADEKRRLGQIQSGGGFGCSKDGTSDFTRMVNQDVDEVDMALDEVFRNFRSRVIKRDSKKDWMYLYNRGINRSVIAPILRRKLTVSTEPTIVFLIDVSGSMDTRLIDRILKTISNKMRKVGRGLNYNIISWSTELEDHIKDINPRKGVPRISSGGGTRMARGIKFFKENYTPDAILILISDFEDYLDEWKEVESTMPEYTMYGFNYGSTPYDQSIFKNLKVRNFK